MKLVEITDAPERTKKAETQEAEPVYRPGGATVVLLNDPYTPGEVAVEAVVACTKLSPAEAMKRIMKAHTGGWSPIASYSSKDVAESVAENIMKHARANKNYDHYRSHPHFKSMKGPWPLTAEVMDADEAGGK